jgi:hypothetical protein
MPPPKLEAKAVSLGYTTMLAEDDKPSRHTPIRVQLGAWNLPTRQ